MIVLYGDTPFIDPNTLERMIEARASFDLVMLGFDIAEVQPRYGRLIMDGDKLVEIVEYKDATEEQRAIRFTNSGLLACNAKLLFDLIDDVSNDNASGEYYLTEIVALANKRGLSATAIKCDEAETLGVDSRKDLAEADAAFQTRARNELLDLGVTLMAPETVYLSADTIIGRDTVIEPNVVFGPGVTVESGATIRAFSHLEGCHVSRAQPLGPMPDCAREQSWPRTRGSATLSRPRMRGLLRAPKSTTSAISETRRSGLKRISVRERLPVTTTAS